MRPILALVTLSALLSILFRFTPAFAEDDGIPDNCQYTQSPEQQAIIPRYSASTQRLVLVSWTTGDEIRALAENVQVVSILGWSADCRYLAVAEGTPDIMSTVVYDTTNSQRMGSVDDAHHKPHPITWGSGDNLVVETRNGAILWNVPTGQRFTLTQSYNTTTGHNFSRLRWDGANRQLIADLAVGGRVIYDLATGAEVSVAAQQPDTRAIAPNAPQVVIGGRPYSCFASFDYGYRNWFDGSGVPDVFLYYDVQNSLVVLQLNDIDGPEETIQTLQSDVHASYVINRGWSPTCRYLAASLGIVGQDASDTVVYDVTAGKVVGVVPDARHIMHPLEWGNDGKSLLVQTRNGGILWDLPTNTQKTLNNAAEIPLAGRQYVRNFNASAWTNSQLLAVPVDTPNTVVAYDLQGGEGKPVITFDHAVKDLIGEPGGWAVATLEVDGSSYNRNLVAFRSDGSQKIDLGVTTADSLTFSPDSYYLALWVRKGLGVWNTSTGQQIGMFNPQALGGFKFIDNMTLSASSGATLNVETGAYSSPDSAVSNQPLRPAVAGQDGTGASTTEWWNPYAFHFASQDTVCKATGEAVHYDELQRALVIHKGSASQVLVTNLNATRNLAWSPDCKTLSGGVAVISNAALPYDDAPLDDIYRDHYSYDVTFWNATTGETLGAFPRPYRFESPARVDWSAGSERAFVRTTQGYFIFDPATREQIPLHYAGPTSYATQINTYYHLYWDFTNGRLFTTAWGGALAFDLRTGERIAFLTSDENDAGYYYGDCQYGGCSFDRSADGKYLYVFGATALGQYDFLTLQAVHVDVDNAYSVQDRATATSPDGHYLVVGNEEVRVWDVKDVPAAFIDRDPMRTFHGPEGQIAKIAFTDNTTLAVTTYYGELSYWNVEKGQQIPNAGNSTAISTSKVEAQ